MTISNRQPAGVPTGGQFTAGKRDESPTQLDAAAVSYTHLDVYKRQAKAASTAEKSNGNPPPNG